MSEAWLALAVAIAGVVLVFIRGLVIYQKRQRDDELWRAYVREKKAMVYDEATRAFAEGREFRRGLLTGGNDGTEAERARARGRDKAGHNRPKRPAV